MHKFSMLGDYMHLSMRFACDRGHENARRPGAFIHVIVIAFHREKASGATKRRRRRLHRRTEGGSCASNARAATKATRE